MSLRVATVDYLQRGDFLFRQRNLFWKTGGRDWVVILSRLGGGRWIGSVHGLVATDVGLLVEVVGILAQLGFQLTLRSAFLNRWRHIPVSIPNHS